MADRTSVPEFQDALRGYALAVHERDGWKCQYCGLDGRSSFSSWLSLHLDHLLPKSDPRRDDPEFTVTACHFCNIADNRYFDMAQKRGLKFAGLTREQLIQQRKPFVERTRSAYKEFWEARVSQGG